MKYDTPPFPPLVYCYKYFPFSSKFDPLGHLYLQADKIIAREDVYFYLSTKEISM